MKSYDTEEQYLNKIQRVLENCGCEVWREVVPDEHKNREYPFRVDLILFRNDLGYIAVEGKNCNTLRQGSVIGKAVKQIEKYRELHYFNGIEINKWCVTLPQKTARFINGDEIEKKEFQSALITEISFFVKNFLKYMYDILLLEFVGDNRIMINSYTKGSICIKKEWGNGY